MAISDQRQSAIKRIPRYTISNEIDRYFTALVMTTSIYQTVFRHRLNDYEITPSPIAATILRGSIRALFIMCVPF